uniref:Ubiquitin-like protease family profile domain-containing protein n=1 Tax=Lactuca sativa TaxID=4236 RepID=A0A9R1XX75_LACSA|nr:hypothetical protein LSAT_V11C200076590 [Lactuca sativa]
MIYTRDMLYFCDMESDSASDHDEESKQRGLIYKAKANKVELVITYNKKGVPVGKEATKLSTFKGLVARTMVPITYASWLEEKFVVDSKSRKQTLQSIGKKWRNFKHYLYAKFIKNQSKDPKVNLFKPPKDYPFIKKEDLKVFVSHKVSKKWEEKSTKAKNTRAHHKYNHHLSRKGYAGLINDIMQETGKTEEEIDRTLMSCRNLEALERLHVEHMMCLQRPWVLSNNVGVYEGWNVKYYLDIENERVDKRINKLEDDLEKLKRGVLNVSEAASCQVEGVIEDVEKEPRDESLDNSCLLAVEFAANVVAKGTIMKYSASDENIEVMMETIFQGETLIPIPLEEEFIVKVKDALGHMLSWPRHLVIRCSDLVIFTDLKHTNEFFFSFMVGKLVTLVKKHTTPVKKHATPVKQGATPLKEEIGSNKKEKGTGKMVDHEQKEPCDVEEKKKIKKKEKQNVTLQTRWTRAHMKTRIRIEKSSILKMTEMMVDGQVTKVDSIKVQSENGLFGYDSYTYLNWDDFEAVLTMDELTGVVIVSYMMVLFKKMKYGSPERDHGICFVNPTLISPSTRKGKSKNIDDASRGLADWLSKRKGNEIIFMPYNPGRHWVLGVLDMKSDTCYYLDSLSSANFNMQLKQIVHSQVNGSVRYTKWIQQKVLTLFFGSIAMTILHCPVQPGGTECGYYMLRFMKEMVEEGIEVLVKDNIGDGKVEYTTNDIDEIREEWSEFVTGFIYR